MSGKLPPTTPRYLNKYVIWIALPATILSTVPKLEISSDLLIPASMPWVVFLIGLIVFGIIRLLFHFEKPTLGALILTGSLGNTSFVGFPMLTALIGQEALKTGIIIDQAGSFLVVSTLGVITASIFSHHATSVKAIVKRILTFPPFIILIVALLTREMDYHPLLALFFKAMSHMLGPVALIAVGYQLRFDPHIFKKHSGALTAGLTYKLILAPAIIASLYALTGLGHEEWLVTSLEAAMPPMITAAIIANEHHLDEELTSLMVGIGIPLSIAMVPIWYLILR